MMAPRTREQVDYDRLKQENEMLKAQLAFLGGAVVGAINGGSVGHLDRLGDIVGRLSYLNTLPGFAAMMDGKAAAGASSEPKGTE